MSENKENQKNEKNMSRLDFLKMGLGVVIGGAVLNILGCKQNSTTAHPQANLPIPQAMNFIGNPSTRVYHRLRCTLAPAKNMGAYFDSPVSAARAGYKACVLCKPNEIAQ